MSNREFEEKCLTSERIYEGKIIQVQKDTVLLPDGKTASRDVVRHPGAVGIVAIKEGHLLMVRQYRYALGQETLEIPAGKLEQGEDPKTCAERELREETGYRGDFTFLGKFHTSPGFADEVIHLYLAKALQWAPLQADDDEFLGLVTIPWEEAIDQVVSGKIQDAKSLVGILLVEKMGMDIIG